MTIWMVLWINFIARDFYKKDCLREYKVLAGKHYEERRANVYGVHFYELLVLAKGLMPPESYYEFAGIEDLSLASRRGIYYLYPCLKKEDPEYVIVYDKSGFQKEGYRARAELDNGRFILNKE